MPDATVWIPIVALLFILLFLAWVMLRSGRECPYLHLNNGFHDWQLIEGRNNNYCEYAARHGEQDAARAYPGYGHEYTRRVCLNCGHVDDQIIERIAELQADREREQKRDDQAKMLYEQYLEGKFPLLKIRMADTDSEEGQSEGSTPESSAPC
jgi:hypothetical protein